jgi:hypothetical protein
MKLIRLPFRNRGQRAYLGVHGGENPYLALLLLALLPTLGYILAELLVRQPIN